MSVVSLARTAAVTGLPSKIRLWSVSTSVVLAAMSMMSTKPGRRLVRFGSRIRQGEVGSRRVTLR